jgi:hypothetical protein
MPLVLFVGMCISGWFANDYALPSGWHHIPFWAAAVLALIWSVCIERIRVVLVISALLAVGMLLRAGEVLSFSDDSTADKIVAATNWVMLAIAYHAFGMINQTIVIFRSTRGRTWEASLDSFTSSSTS